MAVLRCIDGVLVSLCNGVEDVIGVMEKKGGRANYLYVI